MHAGGRSAQRLVDPPQGSPLTARQTHGTSYKPEQRSQVGSYNDTYINYVPSMRLPKHDHAALKLADRLDPFTDQPHRLFFQFLTRYTILILASAGKPKKWCERHDDGRFRVTSLATASASSGTGPNMGGGAMAIMSVGIMVCLPALLIPI
jgi:hypothetical protein